MYYLSKLTSYVFHPLWLMTIVTALLMVLSPVDFFSSQPAYKGVLLLSIFFTTALIPGIAVIMMKFLKLIPSIEMPEKEHRIGPLIIGGIFHIWMFKNFTDNPDIPDLLTVSTLAVIVTLFLCFMINLFFKLSLHAAGISTLLSILVLSITISNGKVIPLYHTGDQIVLIHPYTLIGLGVVMAGWIGSTRLFLGAHSKTELLGGYFIGVFGPVLTFIFF